MLKFNTFQMREEHLGIGFEVGDNVDTDAPQINQKVKDCNLCSEPLTSSTDETCTFAKITDQKHMFYPLLHILSNDDLQFCLELMMDNNPMP
jgi:hypothetical protein